MAQQLLGISLRMRRFLPYLLTLAILGMAGAPVAADIESTPPTKMAARDLAPGQTEYGAFAVQNKLNKWSREAKAQGISLATYTKTVLRSVFQKAKIPVIVDPSGVTRTLDGHHKLSALLRVQKQTGVSIPVTVVVVKDYKGFSEAQYASHFVNTLRKGWFGSSAPKDAIGKVRSLPSSYPKMRDNPLRSVLGLVFDNAGLEGSWFKDYVQFHLGSRLMASGLLPPLPKNPAQNPKYLKAVAKVVFGHAQFTRFLQSQVKPQHVVVATPHITRVAKKSSVKQRIVLRLAKTPKNTNRSKRTMRSKRTRAMVRKRIKPVAKRARTR